LQFVDVCVAAQGVPILFAQEFLDDLFGGLAKMGCKPSQYRLRGFTHPAAAEFYGCALSYSLETATWVNRWETRRLQELARTETGPDSSEHPNVESVRRVVLNALLLLTHYELDPILVEGAPLIRRAKMKGRHFLAELARARFLSEMLKRKAFRRVRPPDETGGEEVVSTQSDVAGEGTGIKYQAHWRMAHWRVVHYGKRAGPTAPGVDLALPHFWATRGCPYYELILTGQRSGILGEC
jgi:hypothetical protein